MRYLVTAKEMKQYDNNTINIFGMAGVVLMERAALSAADIISARFPKNKTVLIAAGTGNNGGDGIALGRILWQKGYDVTFCLLGEEEKCSPQTKQQIEIIKKYSLSLQTNLPQGEYDIMVDAIFGIGLNRDIEGFLETVIHTFNEKKGYKISLDIPSGVCADTGKIYHVAVKADLTVTFAFEKLGQFLLPGNEYCGEIICTEIGITEDSFQNQKPSSIHFEKNDLNRLPQRDRNGNKGSFGKVLLIAGSKDMNGAAVLAAKSAYRTGAGMVKVLCHEENREILQTAIPEALVTSYQKIEEVESIWDTIVSWADVIAIGPGIGMGEQAEYLVKKATILTKPLVCDADALNIIAKDLRLCDNLKGKQVILTPHAAEFSRLLQKNVRDIKLEVMSYAAEFAKKYQITLVCKDAKTVVSHKGKDNYINTSGNEGMATAGSGDVLTGIISGLLAQGMTEKEAAMLGVYIHGVAGDRVKRKNNSYSLIASDMIEELKYVLGETVDEPL